MLARAFCLCLLLFLAAGADPVTDKMVSTARAEWDYFGRQTLVDGKITHPGHTETEDGWSDRVGVYWREGVNRDLTGKNTEEPWSAAFMSWVMRQAGLGDRFSYSEWHATYIRRALRARRNRDPKEVFWAYRLSERAPRVGDLVCYARQDDIDFDHQKDVYKSHTDLVVEVRPGEIDVIGGNVQDSVSLKTLATDPQGHLIDTHERWFAVMANRLEP